MEVDVASRVRLVVATHAHDDHIAGIAEVYSAAKSAQFVLSAAATTDEFYADVALDASLQAQVRESIREEFRLVREEARSRPVRKTGRHPILVASEAKILFSRASANEIPAAQVIALTPSDSAQERARVLIANGSGAESERKRLSPPDPNEFAVALWIEVGDVAILLGADVINGPSGCGWKGVLMSHSPAIQASLFKVPHHGSPNAHHQRVVDEYLTDDVVALVAPFRAGVTPRPSPADVERIMTYADRAFTTASSKYPAPTKATKVARTSMATLARNVNDPYGQVGHVRARRAIHGSDWKVDLFAPARALPEP